MENMRSVVFEVPLSVSMEAMWACAMLETNGRCPVPEVVPEVYASVEGPWFKVGKELHVKFNNGLRDCKWTLTALDLDAHSTTWSWVEEEAPMAMRHHVISVVYVATGAASCSVHFSIHFDGEVSPEYAQALKQTLTQTVLLYSSRLISTAQPN